MTNKERLALQEILRWVIPLETNKKIKNNKKYKTMSKMTDRQIITENRNPYSE